MRAGLSETSFDASQRFLAAVDELGLDLAEGPGDASACHDRDEIQRHVGDGHAVTVVRDPDSEPARSELRDRTELAATQVCGEEAQHLRGRAGRSSARLELEPRGAPRELQLPEPTALLDPAPQRDALVGQAVVLRIEVGRSEHARLE